MANPRLLILFLALAAVQSAHAAGPCEENRGQTGLGVVVAPAGGLAVAVVDDDSAAAGAGLRVGDEVVQVNGALPRTCGEYARSVRDARREHKAMLLLVRRGGGEVPLVLAASAWERAVAVVQSPPPEPPTVRALVAAPPPPPLPPETHVSVEEVTSGLAALGSGGRGANLGSYQRDVLRVRRQVETLAARSAAPAPVLVGLRTVLKYYEGAGVAWASEETQREREHRPRHLAAAELTSAPFFADSEVAALIDEFPFLRATVTRDPSPGMVGESGGVWRPREARMLLWEHGHEELDRLTGWLAAGRPQDGS